MNQFINRKTRQQAPSAQQAQRNSPSMTTKLHTGRRGDAYLSAVRALDTHSAQSAADLGPIIDAIRKEFEDKWAAVPLGLVSHCFLGHPYETHILAPDGHIVEHYEHGKPLPGEMDRARQQAKSEAFLVIEVYKDKLICIRQDGTTVTVEG